MTVEEKLDRIVASMNEVELKMRLGKLDSLFLLIPTITGITFSILQYSLRGIADVDLIVDLLPILILNVSLPLYIGYYRGGIKLNGHIAILERARGRIYLVAGTVTYVSLLVEARIILELLPELVRLTTHLDPFLRDFMAHLLNGAIATTLAFAVWGGSSRVGVRFLSLFEAKVSDGHRQVLGQTARAGTAFALATLFTKFLSGFPLIVAAFVACGGLYFEWRARTLMSTR